MVLLNREASLSDQFGCASGCQEANILLDQAFGEVEQSGLVVDGEYCWRCGQ